MDISHDIWYFSVVYRLPHKNNFKKFDSSGSRLSIQAPQIYRLLKTKTNMHINEIGSLFFQKEKNF